MGSRFRTSVADEKYTPNLVTLLGSQTFQNHKDNILLMIHKSFFYNAWAKLIYAYLASFILSFAAGMFLILVLKVGPQLIFEISTKRLSYAFSVFETSAKLGVDQGIMLFVWNTLGALFTISLLYFTPLFNRNNIYLFPQRIRRALCGSRRMKILCFLPGCMKIQEESLRRLFVWVMIPWLGIILLGIESGLTVSTSAYIFGSYSIGFISLIPHGIIEIPTICFAGAVSFAANLLIKEKSKTGTALEVFEELEEYKNNVPLQKCIIIVVFFLLIAGLVEGHITQKILDILIDIGV